MDARTNEPLARTSIARTDPAAIARYANGATDSIVGTVAPSEARAKTLATNFVRDMIVARGVVAHRGLQSARDRAEARGVFPRTRKISELTNVGKYIALRGCVRYQEN